MITAFFEHGVSPATLDQILALERAPEVAIRLLLHSPQQELSDVMSLEVHGGPRWMFVSPESWGKAVAAEQRRLQAQFASTPGLADLAEELGRKQLSARTSELLTLRPELAAHIAIGLLSKGLASPTELPNWLRSMPPGIANPKNALQEHANRMARRHAEQAKPLHHLKAQDLPAGMEDFDPDVQGLIEAPVFVSEVAYGLRPLPDLREMIELLQAIYIDPGAFETALPAAMAWQFSRQNG